MAVNSLLTLLFDYLPQFHSSQSQRLPLDSQHSMALQSDEINRLSLSEPNTLSSCDPYELGKAVIRLQIEMAARRDRTLIDASAIPYFLGIDFISAIVPSKGVKDDVETLLQIATENGMSSTDLRKLWSWTALPYIVRHAGLARDAGAPGQDAQEGRLYGIADCVADQDSW